MLLLAALFAVHCFSCPASGEVREVKDVSVETEDDEGGPEEVWLTYDLGIPDHSFRKRHGRNTGEATPSSLEEGEASPSSLKGRRATASSLPATASQLALPKFLAGILPASPSALLKAAGTRRLNIHVTKTWGDGNSLHTQDQAVVHLLSDGEDTGQVLVLNAENGWEGSFTGLPAVNEQGAVEYSVSEEAVGDYVPFYSYSGGADEREYWVPAEEIEEGTAYVLASDGISPTAEGGAGSVVMRQLDRQTRAKRLDGRICHDYIIDPEEDAQWVFSAGTRGFEMRNAETDEILTFGRVGGSNVFYLQENPAEARRAYFTESDSAAGAQIAGEIGAFYLRPYALSAEGGAVSKGEGAQFQLYRRSSGNWEMEVAVSNRRTERPDPKVTIPHRKTIDAFRDGQENPDTALDNQAADRTDLYRLYLDAGTVNETQPLNVVMVLDYSGSMNPREDDPRKDNYYMEGQTRYEVLRDTVCPVDRDGIVDIILSDPDNRMSLVTFSWMYEENTVIAADWTDSAEEIRQVILNGNPAEGTNYDLALRMVSELLGRIPESRKDYPTYVLFMSDGVPTEYVTANGLPGGYVSPGVSEVSGPGGFYGSVGVETLQNLELVIPRTLEAVERFQENWPKVNISAVAFSNQDMAARICVPEYVGGEETEDCVDMPEGYTYDMVLRRMIQNRGAFYTAATGEELRESFEDMILASRVSHAVIADTLSAYTEVYAEQPDYKVTMKKEGEDAIVLWENGTLTAAGAGKLRSVVSDGEKRVSAEFEPDYVLEEDYVYTLSFNVRTTTEAYEEFARGTSDGEDGYGGVRGDASERYPRETDYGENATSTDCPGFHSDAEAAFEYAVKGRLYSDPYLHPVVQVSERTLEIRKVDSRDETVLLSGASFDLYRRADAASEGAVPLPGASPEERFLKVNPEPLVTGEEGSITVHHLVPGVYRLWELEAPKGYQLPEETIEVVLSGGPGGTGMSDGTGEVAGLLPGADGVTVLVVKNLGKVVLPAAGGMGSAALLLAGISAAAAGAALRRYNI